MKTILVAYDGSEAAGRALSRTSDLALAFDSRVLVVTVEPIQALAAASGAGGVPPVAELEDWAVGLLEEARQRLEARGVEADFLARVGDPAAAIVELAESHGADLVVTGTNEPGFFERLLAGSVSEAVSRRAPCDVLIVH